MYKVIIKYNNVSYVVYFVYKCINFAENVEPLQFTHLHLEHLYLQQFWSSDSYNTLQLQVWWIQIETNSTTKD